MAGAMVVGDAGWGARAVAVVGAVAGVRRHDDYQQQDGDDQRGRADEARRAQRGEVRWRQLGPGQLRVVAPASGFEWGCAGVGPDRAVLPVVVT